MTDKLNRNLWGGRFKGEADPGFAEFNRSFGFDRRLFEVDVRASIAHCDGLAGAGVLTARDSEQIRSALTTILERGRADAGYFDETAAEDVHSFVEARLVEMIGDAGRKLHTGRSRNDQVATDLRLWLREEIDRITDALRDAQQALLDLAEANRADSDAGIHALAARPAGFVCSLVSGLFRNAGARSRTACRRSQAGQCLAAWARRPWPELHIRSIAMRLLMRSASPAVSRNSLDAVSDRDFCIEFAGAASLIMLHLSRLAEDIILYSTTEFGFFELSDAIATGSSLMPQKKNPDSMELVRGKAGRVFGHLTALARDDERAAARLQQRHAGGQGSSL